MLTELFSVLRNIINEIAVLEDSDPARLAKYARCLFQTIIASNQELGGRLLDEACRMASEAHGVCIAQLSVGTRSYADNSCLQTPAAWPTEELEWFASAAYNHSIDLWGRDEDEACRWWAEKAMSMAHHCRDGGQLEALLQAKYVKLRLDANAEQGGGGRE